MSNQTDGIQGGGKPVQSRICGVCNTVHDLPLCPQRATSSEENSAAREHVFIDDEGRIADRENLTPEEAALRNTYADYYADSHPDASTLRWKPVQP